MSDAHNQGEPTMEEILASIRKIISEDGTPSDREAAAEADEEVAAQEPEESAETESTEAEEAVEDDVLNLTQMVGEDGGVVDLEEEGTKSKAGSADASGPADDFDPEPKAEAVGQRSRAVDAFEEAPPPEVVAVEEDDEPHAPAAGPVADESLVSDPARAAATASLASLAMAAGPTKSGSSTPLTDSKTLEDLVRELMRPYLKNWLDQHLAGLVERIVRDEIQKMVKRAEYR